ncbi:murein hydrolase activator EnvC family protein [Tenuifilum thalassicum]|uniref:murein hydrolase activator EnvC family protein n=1 Tax=Tenuifilum thalassicum TaxID=2590900 RepID=UPI00156604DA|nr:M23 family metallopeptidase [Tenuifilum thalassicum]
MKYVKIQNNGLDLLLVNDYKVYCVEEGEVSKVFNIPYGGKAIIVRHGDYLSLYSNLSVVYVKPGNIVDSNTVLGKVLKQNDNTYILHFEIWNKTEPENPSNWINFDN